MPDVVHRYQPRGACKELFSRRDPEVLVSGPAGTGKSRACLEKLHAMCLANPGMRALMVRKTAVSLADAALQTFRQYVIPEALSAGFVEWYGGSRQEPAQYRYSNDSAIMVGGMDNATKVMSTEYDVIYVQEAIELSVDDWEALNTRLRNGVVSFQQMMADTNPDTPFHWLYKRVQDGKTVMLDSRHTDNPRLYTDDGELTRDGVQYIARLQGLTGARRQRLLDGLWVAAEGIIYDEWDPKVHVCAPFPIPDSWPRWWVMDFGYVNPFVCQFWAEDPDGRLWMYREIYHSRRLVEDHCNLIKQIVSPGGNWVEPQPRAIICDHDAEDRATVERHLDQGTLPAIKSVTDGIEAVKSRLRDPGDGKGPRIRLFSDALVERDQALEDAGRPTETAQEALAYVWKRPPKTVERPPEDQPEKENDHGMDCLRYMCLERSMGDITTRMLV